MYALFTIIAVALRFPARWFSMNLSNGHSHPSSLSFSVRAFYFDSAASFDAGIGVCLAIRQLSPRQHRGRVDGSQDHQEITGMRYSLAYVEPTDRIIVEHVYKRTLRDGEERLMLAVLQSAIEDYQKFVLAQDRRGRELFEQAEEWILETGSTSFFSFENICSHLQLAPDYVRRGFLSWKARQLESARPKNPGDKASCGSVPQNARAIASSLAR
jgi:hypothetical protein